MQEQIQNNTDIKLGSTIAFIIILVVLSFAVFFFYQSGQTELDTPVIRHTPDLAPVIDVLEVPADLNVETPSSEKLLDWQNLLEVYQISGKKPKGFKSALLQNLTLKAHNIELNIALLEFENAHSSREVFYTQITDNLKWIEDSDSYVLNNLSYRLLDKYLILTEFNESLALKKYLKSIYSKLKKQPLRFVEGKYLNFISFSSQKNSHLSDVPSYEFSMGRETMYLADAEVFVKKQNAGNVFRKYSIGNMSIQRIFSSKSNRVIYFKLRKNYVLYTKPLKKHLNLKSKAKLIKLFYQ
ncbi:hypothetical protein MJH12_09530 [bacterium]|nr:hypothetical protein [bacterium]